MWIRSQDKKIFTEVHDVDIDSVNQIWGSGSLIGEYSTEEKALKVLDDIEGCLEYQYKSIFQMPQDDEV